eukprot:3464769-Amphidinium_carterae.1
MVPLLWQSHVSPELLGDIVNSALTSSSASLPSMLSSIFPSAVNEDEVCREFDNLNVAWYGYYYYTYYYTTELEPTSSPSQWSPACSCSRVTTESS